MAKRKAGVNDIIYELDNEDIASSSEDEVKEPKIVRLEAETIPISSQSDVVIEESCTDVINVDNVINDAEPTTPNNNLDNGGKIHNDLYINHGKIDLQQTELDHNKVSPSKRSTIITEDDKDESNRRRSAGTGDRIPLLTVHIKNKNLARYKENIKEFFINLMKLDSKNALDEFVNENDLQLDIWPEDLVDDTEQKEEEMDDSLFFVDTEPCSDRPTVVPSYRKLHTSILISDEIKKSESPSPTPARRPINCFNCDGNHNLKDCPKPRNAFKIAERRRHIMTKTGRYHLEDDQKFGHLVPGRISRQLRSALGLKRHQLPLHIYRMRLLGYPPGWMEEARVSHSGITMFDSTGKAIMDSEDEEGMICEPGYKDKFDIKKILDFPGFNVPASPQYEEEAHLYGLPSMSDQDSKVAMLQTLAPNAMMAYKRKKLTISDTSAIKIPLEGQAEMELDSDDEKAEFPSVPPLPDEAPPSPPPPPPASPPPLPPSPASPPAPPLPACSPPLAPTSSPPLSTSSPLPPQPPSTSTPTSPSSPATQINNSSTTAQVPESLLSSTNVISPKTKATDSDANADVSADDDVEVKQVTQVQDIPMPSDDIICDKVTEAPPRSGRGSPSLDDLEAKKKLILHALEDEDPEACKIIDEEIHNATEKESESADDENITEIQVNEVQSVSSVSEHNQIPCKDDSQIELNLEEHKDVSESEIMKTPDSKTAGHVKTTQYGAPVMNIASHYEKLPSDDKFAKDITDVINFENLPNSTGIYKKMCSLLKKVKSEVDRIQES